MIDSKAVKDSLITFVRHTISASSGGVTVWALKKGFDVSGELPIIIGLAAAFIVNVMWAVGEKLLRRWKLSLALDLPASATREDLHEIAEQVPVLTRITQAITVPTAEQIQKAKDV